jgi:hypothetical protein
MKFILYAAALLLTTQTYSQTSVVIEPGNNAQSSLKIDGNGVVRTNTATFQSAAFAEGMFTISNSVANGACILTFAIPTFTGTTEDVRVVPAQFKLGTGNSNWGGIVQSYIINRLEKQELLLAELARLARRRVDYNVMPDHYVPVGEALLWTQEQGLGAN